MARYKGTFSVAANYEPLVGGPFDARQLVETKSDLINPNTWRQANGETWTYVGMIVSVSSDVNTDNNGLYVLKDKDYTNISNWEKQATDKDIASLQKQIEEIEVSGGSLDLEFDLEADLPEVGNPNATYYVLENKSIYRWQEETQSYVSFGGESSTDLDINIIYGGNANGNTD